MSYSRKSGVKGRGAILKVVKKNSPSGKFSVQHPSSSLSFKDRGCIRNAKNTDYPQYRLLTPAADFLRGFQGPLEP